MSTGVRSAAATLDQLAIGDGQVSDAIVAFDSVWLVLGQQGLVERFSSDVLTLPRQVP